MGKMSVCDYCKGRFPEAECKLTPLGLCAWEEAQEEEKETKDEG